MATGTNTDDDDVSWLLAEDEQDQNDRAENAEFDSEDMSIAARMSRLDDDEHEEIEEAAGPDEFEKVLRWGEEQRSARATADAEFAAQYEQALAISPDYQPPPPPLTPIEEAAKVVDRKSVV